MGAARAMFDESKHPRGFHGRFGSGGGVVRRSRDVPWSNPGRGSGVAPMHLSAAAERARKLKIRQETEVARGVRQPASFRERLSLEWASPRKIAEQRAKTGDALRPRLGPEGALHTARQAAGGFRSNANGTMGTRRTFAGKAIRVHSTSEATRLTARGRYVKAKYGSY